MTRQVIVSAFGGPSVLEIRRVAEPHAGAGQVRVRVTAAGLNPVDLRIAEGGATAFRFGVTPPYVNGNDFAGVIDEVGAGVEGWRIGDRVYGGLRCRAQSDHVVTSDLDDLVRTPDALNDVEAAALDIAARTAWAGINALELNAGETVLISAAAGGCGFLASQIALRAGARVIGTASARNHAFLRELGVIPLDHREDLRAGLARIAPEGVSAVFDAFGGEYVDLALQLGVLPRRINSIGDRAYALEMGALSVGRATTPPSALAPLGEDVARGDLRVWIDEVYAVEDVVDAYERLDSGHVRGKLVLDFALMEE